MSVTEPTSAFDRSTQPHSSRPASVFSAQSIDTLVTSDNRYRGYPSEQAYLDALKEWAHSKMFYEADEVLTGFYGQKTADDILAKQGTSRHAKSKRQLRRATLAAPQLETVAERNNSDSFLSRHSSATQSTNANKDTHSTGSKLKRVFTRRKTVV